jgi:hypothetical protein
MLHCCSLSVPAHGCHQNEAPDAESSALANRLVAVGCEDSLALDDTNDTDNEQHSFCWRLRHGEILNENSYMHFAQTTIHHSVLLAFSKCDMG